MGPRRNGVCFVLRAVQTRCPAIWLVASILGVGCASSRGEPAGDDGGPAVEAFHFRTPVVEAVTPAAIALGDRIQVFGHDFVDPDHGSMRLILDGTFETPDHQRTTVQEERDLTLVNESVAQLTFDTLFAPAGVGTFFGSAKVVSRIEVQADNAAAGAERTSKQVAVTMSVLASIDLTLLHSVDTDECAPVTKATNAGSELALGLRVVGLGEGSTDAPLRVRVGFLSPALKVTYVKDDVYAAWPFDWHPADSESVYTDAPDGQNTMTFELDHGDELSLDPRSGPIRTQISPSVQIRNQPENQVLLGRMITGSVDPGGGPMTVAFFLQAERAGQSAQRSVTLEVSPEFEVMPYDGNQVLVERYNAEVPPGDCGSCIPGGDIGRDVGYTEGQSISRTRSVSLRWDVNTANSVGLTAGHMVYAQAQLNTSWSSTFGTDVTDAVSTEDHRGLNIQAHVLPTFFGLCYRQLSRYEKTVDVTYHGECGATAIVGQAILTDWGWGFDVATGPDCPPPTNLPPPLRPEDGR
jgi:hypothetical protein